MVSLKTSLSLRLSVYVIVVSLIVFSSCFILYYYLIKQSFKEESIEKHIAQTRMISNNIGYILSDITEREVMMSKIVKDNIFNIDLIEDMLLGFVTGNSDVCATYFAFAPEFNKGERRMIYAYEDIDNITRVIRENYDYTKIDWYKRSIENRYWSDPYLGELSKKYVITYSRPIYSNLNKLMGVLCVDIDFRNIAKLFLRNKTEEDSLPYFYADELYLISASQGDKANFEYNLYPVNEDVKYKIIEKDDYLTLGNKENDFLSFFAPIAKTNWAVVNLLTEKDILKEFYSISNKVWCIGITGIFLIFLILLIIINRELQFLEKIVESTEIITQGCFDAPIANVPYKDELFKLRGAFIKMQFFLKGYIEELTKTTAAKERVESEINIAAEIQMAMLPKRESLNMDIAGLLKPAKGIGGDLYDYLLKNNKLYFVIGDVSGKGLSASLVMAKTISLFRSAIISDVPNIVEHMNIGMCYNNDLNLFVTLFMGVLDIESGELNYINAGHNTFYIIGDKVQEIKPKTNIPLGLMSDFIYNEEILSIKDGDYLFFYTDGVSEAINTNNEEFGNERLKEIINIKCINSDDIIQNVYNNVCHFTKDIEQIDDITMLCLRKAQTHLLLVNDIEEVRKLAPYVEGIGSSLGLNLDVIMKLNIALDELLTNIILYSNRPDNVIHIDSYLENSVLVMIIADMGDEFDSSKMGEISINNNNKTAGGLGIFLAKSFVDEFSYRREDHKNIITLKKYI